MNTFLRNYSNIILLLAGILIGSLIGIFFPQTVDYMKPVGDIFLNLLFVCVVPLVFFAVANSISGVEQQHKFGRIIFSMIITFLFFIITAAIFTVIAVYLFTTEAVGMQNTGDLPQNTDEENWGTRIVKFFTVSEFTNLFSCLLYTSDAADE